MCNLKKFISAMLLSVAAINYSSASDIVEDAYSNHKAIVPVAGTSVFDYCDQHITNNIVSYTAKDDMGSVSSISKKFNEIMKSQSIWFEFCQREGYVDSQVKFDNGFSYSDHYKSLANGFLRLVNTNSFKSVYLSSISEDGRIAVGTANLNFIGCAISFDIYKNKVSLFKTLNRKNYSNARFISSDRSYVLGETNGEDGALLKFKCALDSTGSDTNFAIQDDFPSVNLPEISDARSTMLLKFNNLDKNSLIKYLELKGFKHFNNYEIYYFSASNAAGNILIVDCKNKLLDERNTYILKLPKITIDFDAIKKYEGQ